MKDITCPYCDFGFIDSDYWESDPGELYELDCPNCGKIMMVQYEMRPFFQTYEASCKNEGEHKFVEIHGVPKEYFKYKRRCEYCNEEIIVDVEKNKKEIRKYLQNLDK